MVSSYGAGGRTKFTVYRHKVFDFAYGWAVICHILYWLNKVDVYARTHNCVGHALQLQCRSRMGSRALYIYRITGIWNNIIMKKLWKSMQVVTINCESSLPNNTKNKPQFCIMHHHFPSYPIVIQMCLYPCLARLWGYFYCTHLLDWLATVLDSSEQEWCSSIRCSHKKSGPCPLINQFGKKNWVVVLVKQIIILAWPYA